MKVQKISKISGSVLSLFCLLFTSAGYAAVEQQTEQQEQQLSAEDLSLKLIQYMQEHLAQHFASSMHLDSEDYRVSVSLSRLSQPIVQDFDHIQIHGLGPAHSMRWVGYMVLPVTLRHADHTSEVQFQGTVDVLGPVLNSRNQLPRGHVLNQEDVEYVSVPWRQVPHRSVGLQKSEVLGLQLVSTLQRGNPLGSEMLRQPPLMLSGSQVDLYLYSAPGVLIKSKALTRQEGNRGDLIQVIHSNTQRTLRARVIDDKSVEVRL